ncbi:MAG: diaminopimelate decarboxylase [Thermodesulfovibrionia bacterium]
MHDFNYKNSDLYAEDVLIKEIVERVGTPVYIYSHRTLLRHLKAYQDAFDSHPHLICFALKANSNLAIVRLLARNGCGADVVSGGELFLALKAGISPTRVVYAGVGKTEDEIAYALRSGVLMFNVESSDELRTIDEIAGRLKVKAPIALRVNPDIAPETHPYISTGLRESKFGIPIEDAIENYLLAKGLQNIEILGIHKHIGSQITDLSPFVEALRGVLLLAVELVRHGIRIRHLDIGGGLGIPYKGDEVPPKPSELSKAILPLIKDHDFNLILEPGRSIVGNAGILVTKVLYTKRHGKKNFIIVDGGMNDLIRPSLYNAYHDIIPVKKHRGKRIVADVVGPVCESGDFFAKDRELSMPKRGDLLAVMSAGAYGFTMSSNYNGRPRPAEVLVKGKDFFVIRQREDYNDLIRGVKIPGFLR